MASITVNATGSVPITEHRAQLHVGLEASGDLPGTALAALAAKVERVRGVLAERGVPDGDVVTEQLGVNPRWAEGGRVDGSTAGTTLRIAIATVDDVGPLLDAVLGGVGEGASVQQVVQVPVVSAAMEAEARRLAVEAARAHAAELAAAAGGALGGLLSLLEAGGPVGRPMFAAAMPMAAGPQVHLWEQQGRAAVTVTAVYELVASEVATDAN